MDNARDNILGNTKENPDQEGPVNILFDEIKKHFLLFSHKLFVDLSFFNIYLDDPVSEKKQ